MGSTPNLALEREILGAAGALIAFDEVGRGALAGPVGVGAVLLLPVAAQCEAPTGLKDSKLLSAMARQKLLLPLHDWFSSGAVGFASAAEIDEVGIMRALRLAAERAVVELSTVPWASGVVALVDGNFDWLQRPAVCSSSPLAATSDRWLEVRTVVRGDRSCASIAAASVIAKQERDELMVAISELHPQYMWERNSGYGSLAHRGAIREHGLTPYHRASWRMAVNGAGQLSLPI